MTRLSAADAAALLADLAGAGWPAQAQGDPFQLNYQRREREGETA